MLRLFSASWGLFEVHSPHTLINSLETASVAAIGGMFFALACSKNLGAMKMAWILASYLILLGFSLLSVWI
tara:strand:- start:513 stop:725 length:213 start_codon:yes stop_codon:yes gene_type:complete